MGFTDLDYFILIFYLIGVSLFGLWIGRKQRDTKDYFLGGRNLPWLAVAFSVVATETSVLTFISIPGLAYLTNLNFLQITFGYLIGRIIVSFVFIPAYYRGELSTAYEFLGQRFGPRLRNFSSGVFLVTRLLADGVRLFATAIPLSVLTGWSYPSAIAVIGIVTIIYTFTGGIRAVVWMDVVQMTIYLGGALLSVGVILASLPGGWGDVVASALPDQKFQVLSLGFGQGLGGFFKINYTLITGLLGGAFLSMASHGTDQLIVQRLLTCRSQRESQRALIASGVLVIIQFALFLIIGLMLYAFYQGAVLRSDEIFPRFIVNHLPPGISGLVIAAVFAAAMSTLSSSLNSLASSTMLDLYKPRYGRDNSPSKDLWISRVITLFWGLVLIGGAMLFKSRENPVVELGLTIASFTYGGLLGAFFLGVLSKKVSETAAIVGMAAGIGVMIFVIGFTPIAWPWYVGIGCSITLLVGFLFNKVLSRF